MNVTNPKVSLFFLAFLPQFANAERGLLWPQIVTLGFVFLLCALIIFSLIAIASANLGKLLNRSPFIQSYLHKITALVFIGLAIKLALSGR